MFDGVTDPPWRLMAALEDPSLPGEQIEAIWREAVDLWFLEPASGRRSVLQESTPDVLILPRRPSFTANGKGDSATSAWFAWPGSGRWEIL